jgi:hypothetical protein
MSQSNISSAAEQPTIKLLALSQQQTQAAIDLLDLWHQVSDEEAREQVETGEYLKQVLDEDRLSKRPLFSCE